MTTSGLWKLTWVEFKIFLREPLGAFGSIGFPVLVYLVGGQVAAHGLAPAAMKSSGLLHLGLPVLAAVLIAVSSATSLVTIISIYREGGILKRLRATPLRPYTILTAHVLVKLILAATSLALMVVAGRRFYPVGFHVPWVSFALALLVATWSILSLGFVIASLVPNARFAQPASALILYPMLAVSGLFVPVAAMGPALGAVARVVPLSYAVALLEGIWEGGGWAAHLGDVAALAASFALCVALSAKIFRWE